MNKQSLLRTLVLSALTTTACAPVDEGELQPGSAPMAVGARVNWGDITPKRCRPALDGRREWSGILWDIPWGQSWEATCARTPASVDGRAARVPDRCDTIVNEWGVWYLPDSDCVPHRADFLSFSTSPSRPCADAANALVRVSFSARVRGQYGATFALIINGRGYAYEPSELSGRGDWSGSVTFDLRAVFGANVPSSFTVEGRLLGSGRILASAQRTVTTSLCN